MNRDLGAPLADAPTLSSIAAAASLVVALELLPGVDHRSTAMGLTAALVLVGASIAAGFVLRRSERRYGPTVGPRRPLPGEVRRAAAVGFVYALAFGTLVLLFKSAWLVDAPLAAAALLLGCGFAAALGVALGVASRDRRTLSNQSLVAFFVLLVPVALCGAEDLPGIVCSALSWLPSVALARLLLAAFTGGDQAISAVADIAVLLTAGSALLMFATLRALRADHQQPASGS